MPEPKAAALGESGYLAGDALDQLIADLLHVRKSTH